jgi:hypothetical protein
LWNRLRSANEKTHRLNAQRAKLLSRLDPASPEDYTPGTFRVGEVPILPEQGVVT